MTLVKEQLERQPWRRLPAGVFGRQSPEESTLTSRAVTTAEFYYSVTMNREISLLREEKGEDGKENEEITLTERIQDDPESL